MADLGSIPRRYRGVSDVVLKTQWHNRWWPGCSWEIFDTVIISLRNQGRWKIFLLVKRLSLNTPKELPFRRATSGTRHWFLNQKFLPQVNGDGKNSIRSGLSHGHNCRRLRNHVCNFYVASARNLAEETVNVTKEIWSARLSVPVMDSAIKTKLWETEHCAQRLTSQYMLKISCFTVICCDWYRINGQQLEIQDVWCQPSRNPRC